MKSIFPQCGFGGIFFCAYPRCARYSAIWTKKTLNEIAKSRFQVSVCPKSPSVALARTFFVPMRAQNSAAFLKREIAKRTEPFFAFSTGAPLTMVNGFQQRKRGFFLELCKVQNRGGWFLRLRARLALPPEARTASMLRWRGRFHRNAKSQREWTDFSRFARNIHAKSVECLYIVKQIAPIKKLHAKSVECLYTVKHYD